MTFPQRSVRVLAVCLAVFLLNLGCQPTAAPQPPQPTKAQASTTVEVCRITAELMRIPPSSVKPETSLGDLNADELDFAELVMELEEHFQIKISKETSDSLLGPDREQGVGNVTMAKLAEVVDGRRPADQ